MIASLSFGRIMMGGAFWMFLVVALFQFLFASADTNPQEAAAFSSLINQWKNIPPDWVGTDPCGWTGIKCKNSHIFTLTLTSLRITGTLTSDIQQLTELTSLDLSYNTGMTGSIPPVIGSLTKLTALILVGCSFSGEIPDEIGSLEELLFLSLNSNRFSGQIPNTIGKLSKLYWLDLADNKLTGSIPVSDGATPGLNMLVKTRHFHFGQNMLSGDIPDQLFSSNMHLMHVLFDNNSLTGSIPSTLGLVTTLEVIRLDRNSLTGRVPSNLNNLTKVAELHLSHNKFTGPLPNLTGMASLSFVDLSSNVFDDSDIPPWFSTLKSLTTLMAEFCKITGELPQTLFSLPNLQTVKLRNNRLNGTLNLGSSYSSQLHLVDVQNNDIQNYKDVQGFNGTIMLMGNSFCQQPGSNAIYCSLPQQNIPYSTGTSNCVPILCPSDQNLSPNCLCAYPYAGTIYFRAPSFSSLGNVSYYSTLEHDILEKFQNHSLPIDSVALSNPHMDDNNYLEVSLQVFPSGKIRFGYSEISDMGFLLSNQTYKPPPGYGPYVFRAVEYAAFPVSTSSSSSSKSTNVPVIIGASVGGFVVATLIVGVLVYAIWQKRKIKRVRERSQPFASWDSGKSSGSVSVPQLKGPRSFTYDELKHSTNNFSEANDIGSGGYGKVYRGMLYTGQLIAIKRAQQGSMQGGLEFKTEIELLSRVHHKHLVSLVGFCFDQGEQLLVYEYVPNGSLKDSLTGKSGIRLDWKRRLRIALGTAKGLTYLHELANPPIVHRDIKSNNILLDDHLNAKVADFGLSKPMGPNQKGHMTTQVKGTMGYLDPEYYMTQQLTEKSDVYSFGVLLLELITARRPIDKGRYIVREVKVTMDRTKDLYNLHELLDPAIVLGTSLGGFGKFVDLALRCVEESGVDRPAMSEVVKEIENIMQLAGMNPNADSATPSASYDGGSRASRHPYGNEANFDYSGGPPSSKVEPK